ncbi:MAG: NAD(P)-dependent oxidoreductase [Archaeoglobaceae archaeon]
MKVGFIGLGHLGKPMARNLISQGADVVVWNRTRKKAEDLGVEIAQNPADLMNKSDIVFLNLTDSKAVESIMVYEDGLLQGDCGGKIIVDTTTNHFEEVEKFSKIFKENEAHYLETPVIGSVIPASQGTLTVLVSGDREVYERASPYLEMIGEPVFFLGEPGLATRMKLINNMVLGSLMSTLAEALVIGEEAGMDREKVLDILSAGAGDSKILNAKREKLLKEDFSTHFKASLIYKDLHYLQDLAREMKMPLFTGTIAKELFGITLSKEMEDSDFSAVYKALKK